MDLASQIIGLLVMALAIASVAWTVTHEEIFREPREYCARKSERCRRFLQSKFFYVFTCEYCFSHYVTLGFLAITRFKMLYMDWRGYLISFFALVWVANVYMNLYSRLRVDIRKERMEADLKEAEVEAAGAENSRPNGSE